MRNLVLNAGLGGLYPNLIVMGFFDLDDRSNVVHSESVTPDHPKDIQQTQIASSTNHSVEIELPTDIIRTERHIEVTTWVNIVEDILLGLNMNIAIGKGMDHLELPMLKRKRQFFFGGDYHAPT